MKILKYVAALLLVTTISSCSIDDDKILKGEGTLEVKFDNSYKTSDLLLSTTSYNATETEKINIEAVKYIVSNIRFEQNDGTIFEYPKESSFYIVDESNTDTQKITLNNIPEGDYSKITFGIGVDQETYLKGAEGQSDLLVKAQETGMMWSWQAGYKFFLFEGNYTSSTVAEKTAFAFHMGSHGTNLDNYKEVTLKLPNTVLVREKSNPSIHVVADVSKVLDGETKFLLANDDQIHVDAVKSPQIAVNVNQMFTIHHVHNN